MPFGYSAIHLQDYGWDAIQTTWFESVETAYSLADLSGRYMQQEIAAEYMLRRKRNGGKKLYHVTTVGDQPVGIIDDEKVETVEIAQNCFSRWTKMNTYRQ